MSENPVDNGKTKMSGVIYKITCTATNKSYIGQAKTHKTKNGKPYKYGSKGRWSDHKATAKTSTTPLASAIRELGADAFVVVDLETVKESDLDATEAHWIETENTLQPNGYNVMSHSRNKHNKESELYNQYVGKVAVAEIHPVKKKDTIDFFYVYLIMLDGSSKRLTFGQNDIQTIDEAKSSALEFVENLDCEVKDFTKEEYKQQTRTLYELTGTIREVTITSASSLVAVYILTSTMKMQKERLRICFGGKTISKEKAYIQALDYIKTLPCLPETVIIDKLKTVYNQCPQQAAATTS